MTGPDNSPQAGPTVGQGQRWTRWLLVASLALNLLIVGVIGGAALRNLRGDGPGGAVRDASFGPYVEALSREDRAALRTTFLGQEPRFQEDRRAARAEFDSMLAALTATPFSFATVEAILQGQKSRLVGRLDTGQRLLLDRIGAMSEPDRRAFAERLERALERGRGRSGDRHGHD